MRDFGTVPAQTLAKIEGMSRMSDRGAAIRDLTDLLAGLCALRGDAYLDAIWGRSAEATVIVTVEKQ